MISLHMMDRYVRSIEENVRTRFDAVTKRLVYGKDISDTGYGAVYNPGSFDYGGYTYLIVRTEPSMWHYERPGISYPMLYKYDYVNDSVFGPLRLSISGHDNRRIEDFRSFVYGNDVYSNHVTLSLCPRLCYVCLSKIDVDGLSFVRYRDINLPFRKNRVEKNWVFFEHDGRLIMIYSVFPWCVLDVTDPNSTKIIYNSSIPINGLWRTRCSLSTNPIRVGDDYLLFVHTVLQSSGMSVYLHRGLLLNKYLLPYRVSDTDLFVLGRDCFLPYVFYMSGVSIHDGNIYMFYGEGDTNTCVLKMNLDKYLSSFRVRVSSVSVSSRRSRRLSYGN